MKQRTAYLFLIFVATVFFTQLSEVSAEVYEVNYNATGPGVRSVSNIVVQTLKYEPYPVNPGDWFDVWIKVQNVGQDDAQNTIFELITEYPFESTGAVTRNYGLLPGTATASKSKQQLGDKELSVNQVLMKYRIRVANNAPIGESFIKLQTKSDTQGYGGYVYTLPIEIGKTKTDFDIVMQDSTSQGTSFAIANIGENSATAVTFSIPLQENVNISGPSSSIIGNLEQGDFTTVTFQIYPHQDLHEVKIQLAYTDEAGVRNTVEKSISVNINPSFGEELSTKEGSGPAKYFYLILGIILGVVGSYLYRKRKKKME